MVAARRSRLLVVAALVAAAACGRIISPPPPSSAPELTHEVVVQGAPIVVAARGARTLQRYSFNTKRFGPDSTWGFRAADSINARLRYTRPTDDSTRVLIEMWGRCPARQRCFQGDLMVLLAGLVTEEGPPQ
jgi:hypothetical protein